MSPENLFTLLFADSPVAVWIDEDSPGAERRSVLASGRLHEFSGPEAFARWRELAEAQRVTEGAEGAPLGLLAVIPYDHARYTLPLEAAGVDIQGWTEPLRIIEIVRSLSVDRETGALTAWALGYDESALDDWVTQIVEATSNRVADDVHTAPVSGHRAHWRDSPERYREMIHAARQSIRDGEAYQLCVTTQVTVPTEIQSLDLHLLLRESSPAPYQAYLRLPEVSIVSASPETFLRVSAGGEVTTRPIKGTRPRGATPVDDEALVTQLRESDKEQAENLMIVDLMRNDLLRVCDVESVRVTGLFEVESYSSVHQLVSTVVGDLRPGCDAIDAVAACFPAGSMTGAPKQRAVELLASLESGPRGVYSGAWGWWRVDGSLDLAMTIRTALFGEGVARIGAGGGITWSSEPDDEIAEVGHKARRVLEALGVAEIQYS